MLPSLVFLEKQRCGSINEVQTRKTRSVAATRHRPPRNIARSSLSSNPGVHLCDTCTAALCSTCRLTLARPSDCARESPSYRMGSSSHSIESSDSAFGDQRLLDWNDGVHAHGNLPEVLLYVLRSAASRASISDCLTRQNVEVRTGVVDQQREYVSDDHQGEDRRHSQAREAAVRSDAVPVVVEQVSPSGTVVPAKTRTDVFRQQTITKLFHERSRETNNELKVLHCEITKLHRMLRDDDVRIRKLGK